MAHSCTVLGNNLQGLDYTYTIEGWLKAINSSVLNPGYDPGNDQPSTDGVGNDLFGSVLDYYKDDFVRSGSPFSYTSSLYMNHGDLFNGNISGWESTTAKFVGGDPYTNASANLYRYDQLNRITSSSTQYFNGSIWSTNNNYSETFSYDGNGNLQSLSRYFINNPGGVTTPTQLDALRYAYYAGKNQLQSVTNSAGSVGLANGGVKTTTYTYDPSGNMASDASNNISVHWTPDNKIDYMSIGSNTVHYLYDAAGNRMCTLTESSSGTMLNTEYYMYDAGGNKLAVYKGAGSASPTLSEREIYGIERLATLGLTTTSGFSILSNPTVFAQTHGTVIATPISFPFSTTLSFGNSSWPVVYSAGTFVLPYPWLNGHGMQTTNVKNYEIHDHLGNVRMTISDTKDANGQAVALSASNYYAFGSPMPMKTVTPTSRFGFNSQEKDDYIYGAGFANTAKYWEYDTRLGRRWNLDPVVNPSVSPYSTFELNPVWKNDLLGNVPDWVEKSDGDVEWDKNANSQATTKAGDTYLGKTLTFEFNNYIDKKLWDGPTMGGLIDPSGDKLTSKITLTGNENSSGELTSITAKMWTSPGKTPIGKPRAYYPGEGGSNNVFSLKGTGTGINLNFEQHASVSETEEFGLNSMGYKIVDVAQKLNINYTSSTGKLSVSAYTDIFPSATLKMNGTIIMQYNQPSFKATHTAPIKGWTSPSPYKDNLGPRPIRDFSYYPSIFYKRN